MPEIESAGSSGTIYKIDFFRGGCRLSRPSANGIPPAIYYCIATATYWSIRIYGVGRPRRGSLGYFK
jgi:hypothetical protein